MSEVLNCGAKELCSGNDFLSLMMEISPTAMMVSDCDGQITHANGPAERVLGLIKDQRTQHFYRVPAWHITDFQGRPFAEEDLPLRRVLLTHQAVRDVRFAISLTDGPRRLLSASAGPLVDESGNLNGVVAVIDDLTERIQPDDGSLSSQDHTRQLAKIMAEAYFLWCEGLFVFVNRAALLLFGASCPEDLLGKPILSFISSDCRQMAERRFYSRPDPGLLAQTVGCKLLRLDGSIVDAEVSCVQFPLDGKPAGQVIVRDIGARKQAEGTQACLAAIVRSSNDAIISKSLDGTIFTWNQAAEEVFGYKASEALGQDITFLIPPERKTEEVAILEKIRQGETVRHYETSRLRKDGTLIAVSVTVSPIKDAKGTIVAASKIARDITERKKAEAMLKASEERYHRLFESVNDGIFLRPISSEGTSGKFIEANNVACNRLGYSREELLQKSPCDIDPGVDAEQLRLRAKQALSGESLIFETVHVARDGRRIPVEISSHHIEWEGQPVMLSVARDLTERRAAEAALRASEENFRSIFANAPVGIFQSTVSALVAVNPTLAMMFGYESPQEMIACPVGPLGFFVQPQQRGQMISEAAESASFVQQEVEYRRKDGSTFTANLRLRAVGNEAGEIWTIEGFVEDITERKRLETELVLREQRLQAFFSNATAGLCVIDSDLRYVQINETLARINGLPLGQHLGKTISELMPGMALMLEPILRRVLVTGAPVLNMQLSGEMPGEAGGVRHWLGSYFPIVGQAGRPIAVGCVVVEISEQKRAEGKLRESEAKFRQLAENIKDVFWMCNEEGTEIIYVSKAYEEVWGQSCQSLYEQPMSFVEAIHPDDRGRITGSLGRLRHGGTYEEEYRLVRPDGSVRWIRDHGAAILNEQGEVYRLAGLAQDITERRRLEEQLRQAQKMEAIGQLAGGVAHDFNNILAATLMQLGLLQQNPELTPVIKQSLKEVEIETLRAANLTRQLLLFSRRQVARMEPLDLNALLFEILKMLRRLLGENIEVLHGDSPEAAWVKADAGMMEQVAMNLCINARDAMPEGGKLSLSSTLVDRDAESIKAHPDARSGHFVCLTVTDTGCGMDGSVLKRLFEPFFTTKEVGKGTGLGLATVYGIVKQHEGWVEVESALGKGSSFRVYIPVLTKPVGKSSATDEREEIRSGSETVLLVEDDPALRRTTALCLRKLGYGVLEATNGREALKLWEQHHQKIELLLTDVVMPEGLTGLQLAKRLKSEKRTLRIIISSGYSVDVANPDSLDPEMTFLAKPFKAVTLAKVVRQCLDKQ